MRVRGVPARQRAERAVRAVRAVLAVRAVRAVRAVLAVRLTRVAAAFPPSADFFCAGFGVIFFFSAT